MLVSHGAGSTGSCSEIAAAAEAEVEAERRPRGDERRERRRPSGEHE